MMEEVDLSDNIAVPKQNCLDTQMSIDQGPPDPQIQIELERLNTCTDLINRLEVDLDEGRMMFRQMLSESTQTIDSLSKKLGKCIEQARPYYEARIRAKQTMNDCQKSAVRFERAVSQHEAAREMVQLSEEGLLTRGCIFDSTWQEMLNHATTKVNDAEREKVVSTNEHREKSAYYHEAEVQVKLFQKELKRSISKSRSYFEMKAAINQRLEEQKRHIKELEEAVTLAKSGYAQALINLEKISDHIHKERENKSMMEIRGVGVGAESSTGSQLNVESTKQLNCISVNENDREKSKFAANKCNWLQQSNSNNEKTKPEVTSRNTPDWQFLPPADVSSSNYLCVDDRESIISDTESLTSIEMLSEEAIANLMLESEIQEVSESLGRLPERSQSLTSFLRCDQDNSEAVDTACIEGFNESSHVQSDDKTILSNNLVKSCAPITSSSLLMSKEGLLRLNMEDVTAAIDSMVGSNAKGLLARPNCLSLASSHSNDSNSDSSPHSHTRMVEGSMEGKCPSNASSSLPSNCSELSSPDETYLGYAPLEHFVEE